MSANDTTRVVVLISGSGSNLQALIDAQQRTGTHIAAVISNRAQAYGLERARHHHIAAIALQQQTYRSRAAFEQELMTTIDRYRPQLVLLAGFMRILSPRFTEYYHGRLLNIHPSLLPKHKGLNTHERVLAAGDTEHGATVHFVSAELDGGAPVIQSKVAVLPTDDSATLSQKVLRQEHLIYPAAVAWFASGRLSLAGSTAMLDHVPLPPCGLLYTEHGTLENLTARPSERSVSGNGKRPTTEQITGEK